MNVNKIKNLTILFFIMLNIVLYAVTHVRGSRYQISDKQWKSVADLLESNNIGVSYIKPIIGFGPLKQLKLSQKNIDIDYMTEWFFGSETTERKDEFDKITISSGTKTLSYDYKQFVFDNPEGSGAITLTADNARLLCADKLKDLDSWLRFELDAEYFDSDDVILEYRGVYKENIIYSSFVKFRVTPNGIVQVKTALFLPAGFDDSSKEIYSCDEALLALMYELKSLFNNQSVIIRKLDMVYYFEPGRGTDGTDPKAIPCYRIYIYDRQEPFLINAYSNTLLKI